MNETTSQRTARLLSMSNAQLIMHAQDLTIQRDELLAAIENVADNVCERMIESGRVVEGVDFHALQVGIRKTIASVKGGAE